MRREKRFLKEQKRRVEAIFPAPIAFAPYTGGAFENLVLVMNEVFSVVCGVVLSWLSVGGKKRT